MIEKSSEEKLLSALACQRSELKSIVSIVR